MIRYSLLVLLMSFCTSCGTDHSHLTGYDIELFEGTKVWKLAKAVKRQDTAAIRRLANKSNIDFQEPEFGATLLSWAVLNDRYYSAKVLAELGANPNIPNYTSPENQLPLNAVTEAADNFDTSVYLKLLIEHGADVNMVLHYRNVYTTPFFEAAKHRLESVQLLVKAGANVNYISPDSSDAITEAALMSQVHILHYLIMDCHADFKNPPGMTDKRFYRFHWLSFPDGSPEQKELSEVLAYMKQNGADYEEYLMRVRKKKYNDSMAAVPEGEKQALEYLKKKEAENKRIENKK